MSEHWLLRAVYSDDCTYCCYEFVGIFTDEDEVMKAQKKYIQRHGKPRGSYDWHLAPYQINDVML